MDRIVCSALPETAASVVVTSIAVGAAVTLLRKRTQALESVNVCNTSEEFQSKNKQSRLVV